MLTRVTASANHRPATRRRSREGERGGRSSVPANHEEFGQTSAARQTLAISDWRKKEVGVAVSVEVIGQNKERRQRRRKNKETTASQTVATGSAHNSQRP